MTVQLQKHAHNVIHPTEGHNLRLHTIKYIEKDELIVPSQIDLNTVLGDGNGYFKWNSTSRVCLGFPTVFNWLSQQIQVQSKEDTLLICNFTIDFTTTARNIKLDGVHLTAELQKRDGSWNDQRAFFPLEDRIAIEDGRLILKNGL